MPNTETPKTPEKKEKQEKQSPETRVKKNETAAERLERRFTKITEDVHSKGEKKEKRLEEKQKKLDEKKSNQDKKLLETFVLKSDKAYRGKISDFSDDQVAEARVAKKSADAIRAQRAKQKNNN